MRSVRLILPSDNEFIRNSYLSSNQEMNVDPIFTQSVLESDLKDPYHHYSTEGRQMWVITNDQQIVGFTGAVPVDPTNFELTRFLILPQFRRQHYGTLLINELKTKFSFILSCINTNQTAIKFYGKLLQQIKIEDKVSRSGKSYSLIYFGSH